MHVVHPLVFFSLLLYPSRSKSSLASFSRVQLLELLQLGISDFLTDELSYAVATLNLEVFVSMIVEYDAQLASEETKILRYTLATLIMLFFNDPDNIIAREILSFQVSMHRLTKKKNSSLV